MTRQTSIVLAGVLTPVLVALAVPAHAHHSWSVDYDTSQTIVVEGVVSEFLRRRPHTALTMDVETPDGVTEQWTVEWGGGFRDSAGQEYDAEELGPGDAITVTGQPHRSDTANSVRLRSVVRESDGLALESSRGGRGRGGNRGGRDRGR